MTRVNIAKLKAQLTYYIRSAKNGEEVVVFDRQTPVAKVIPWKGVEKNRLVTRKPLKDPKKLSQLFDFNQKPVKRKIDSLSILLEMRNKR